MNSGVESKSSEGSGVALRAVDLSRQVGSKILVDGVSVDVGHGDVLAIVGPSGAGKSSFLRLLNRLDEPTGGTVMVDGKDYRSMAPRSLRRMLGMVLQSPFLFSGTVSYNLRYGPAQWGESLSGEREEHLLERVGLAGYGARDISTLSGGEAQRVSLARTLANSPRVLLLDEPTSALDEGSKEGVEALIRDILAEQGLTCVMVTHDMGQAARMANRVMLMESGRMVRTGTVAEVLNASPIVH
ncbi:MAG TPA: phosphate ABC transporter ATP-binding protein [Chloroflexota bacterium]|nr:phosphate ABC transporter ATP-binding protein [Chloroflexota bacterium]